MDPEKNTPDVGNDDAELDKELDATLNSIRTEHNVPTQSEPEAAKTEETPSSEAAAEPTSPAPTEAIKAEETPKSTDPTQVLVDSVKAPVKGKFESDASFARRLELADLIKQRKDARTEEDKAKISGQIKKIRENPSQWMPEKKIIPPNSGDISEENTIEEQKAPTPATIEDVQAIIAKNNFDESVRSTLTDFIGRHPELQDEDIRAEYFRFIDDNYNWNNKTGGSLNTVLELARDNMFRPSETVQERVLQGANVAEKVNAMSFPGGTMSKQGLNADQKQSVAEMVASGMSEEKALELISE